MGVHWKTKQTQKNLLGKSTLAHQSSNLSTAIQCVGQEAVAPYERIVNGGFETGDFTGWDITGVPEVVDYHPHTGLYHAYFTVYEEYIEQALSVAVSAVSSFTCWIATNQPDIPGELIVLITYTDDTETLIEDLFCGELPYTEVDLKPYLTPGKTIKRVRFRRAATGQEEGQGDIYLDDVSLIA